MTSPDLNGNGHAGYGQNSGSAPPQGTATGGSDGGGRTDDVSFGRSMGVDQAADKAKNAAERGLSSAQDAMGQLQAKASELTSNLIDNINVDDLTQKLEAQVRDHPARTLLMAVGAGFLLGRAAKR